MSISTGTARASRDASSWTRTSSGTCWLLGGGAASRTACTAASSRTARQLASSASSAATLARAASSFPWAALRAAFWRARRAGQREAAAPPACRGCSAATGAAWQPT
eukprot:3252628-Pyramimonas_sp.AAC.1